MNSINPDTAIATRISAGDDRTRYDRFSIILHWLTAGLVVVQFILAEFWDYFPRPAKHFLIITHMSLGILLAVVLAVRIVWRLMPGHQVKDAATGIVELASKVVHYLLYILLAAQMVLGILTRWTDNQALNAFGLLIPSPFGEVSRATGGLVDQIHDITAWTIMIAAAGHAAAALFHHFVLRDDVLARMLPEP